MYALTVNYPISDGSTFDMEYYKQHHMPLCARLFSDYGYQGHVLHTGKGASPSAGDLAYATIELLFDSVESLQSGLAASVEEIKADIPNYTNVQPEMSFSEASIELG